MEIKNFHIIKSLERNTLSELFLARHVHDNYTVKIRLYDQYNIANEEVRDAILQRLRNSYQMRHRNIIATLDYGIEGRYMYQIQEHMDHGTLDDLMSKVPHIPSEIACFILQEMLRGLQYAHSIGIFHGMLHPAKILLSSNGIVKLDDFQFLDLKNTFLKQVQTRLKAKQQMYLAPEHLLGKEADCRCDLFSAGVIAYKMLTGKHPFLEERSEWTVMQIIACNAKLMFEMDPTLPFELEDVVEKMIEKELSARIQSAEETLRILETFTTNFGEVRSYDVLANFLKRPVASVEQLDLLRAEDLCQQAVQLQNQEQWDRALVAYSRTQFLKPKDRNIESEIKSLCARLEYSSGDASDPKLLQLEQTLRANPDNIQVLQRIATLAKSRGDLLKCIAYHKRILKLHPKDVFSSTQVRQLLHGGGKEDVFSPNETKWTKWQEFYRGRQRPFWDRWSILQGNLALMFTVLFVGTSIGALHWFHLIPGNESVSAEIATIPSLSSFVVENQKTDQITEQAELLYRKGQVDQAIEILSKAPIGNKGPASTKARLLLASYKLEVDSLQEALDALESIDLNTANLDQKVAIYKLRAEIYRQKGKYGYAIDQYINIQVMMGLPQKDRDEAGEKIQALQEEAMQGSNQ